MQIEPKWLETKDLDTSKFDASRDPLDNAILQFGYDIKIPEVREMFKDEKEPKWFSRLGWSRECEDTFWISLVAYYEKHKKDLAKWKGDWKELKRFRNEMPPMLTLDMPTNMKETVEKSREMLKVK